MIRINLLASERPAVKKKITFQVGHQLTIVCSLILLASALYVGWRFWALRQESVQLDAQIAEAQQETRRLHTIIEQVQQFEQRKAQLQQRVTLIEQLRKDQTGPVHMLDQISRALPPMLWLTDLKQGADPNEVSINGRCITLTALSDFVTNLEASGHFRKSVEIVSSRVETAKATGQDMIDFSIKAYFQVPGAEAKPVPAAPARGRGGRARS
jgi:type IV pilus assembly protein PilN